jgi:transcription elongation factor Elf1
LAPTRITRERAERIVKAHACPSCGEYTFKKVVVKPAAEAHKEALKVAWQARMVCGVCGAHIEVGLDAEGDVVYAG